MRFSILTYCSSEGVVYETSTINSDIVKIFIQKKLLIKGIKKENLKTILRQENRLRLIYQSVFVHYICTFTSVLYCADLYFKVITAKTNK